MELRIRGENYEEMINQCEYDEYAAARCDALQLLLNDNEKELRNMKLQKGEVIRAITDNVDSGDMYISNISYQGESVIIRALSTKLSCFKEKSFYRDNISFIEMVKEIEKETGYKLNLIHTLDRSYIDITRMQQNPVAYLTERLRLEGFMLRVYDNRLIIYDERIQEAKETVATMDETDFDGNLNYDTKDAHLIESIENTYKSDTHVISTLVKSGLEGKNLKTSIAVSSIAESERFTKGLMREANKYEYLTSGWVSALDRKAGQSIDLDCDVFGHNGKNYIYAIKHDLRNERQKLFLRKPIEGDY